MIYGSCTEHQILASELPGHIPGSNNVTQSRFPLAYGFVTPIFLPEATNKDVGGRKPKRDQIGDLAMKSLGQILCFAQY